MKRAIRRAVAVSWFPASVILVLLSPLLLTHRAFAVDFSNHVWLALQQQRAFDAGVWPTLFTHSDRSGPFYPIFAFYGGTGYAALGALAALLGNRTNVADALSWGLGFAMAFGGFSWLSWQVGLRGWRAHVPGLVFVTSAYYLTNMYGRGDWPEFMATSSIPLVVAGAIWLLRAPHWQVSPVAAFALSIVVLAGTHNITALWALTFLPLVALVAEWAFWPAPFTIPVRRYACVFGLAAIAAAVNAWYLLPDVAYASRTAIGQLANPYFPGFPGHWFNVPGEIFSPLRPTAVPTSSPSLYVQLPVFMGLWLLVAVVLLRRRLIGPPRRLAVGLAAIGLAFIGLLLFNEPWVHLPQPWQQTQFAYRVTTYVVLVMAGLVMLTLVLLQHASRSTGRALNSLLAVALVIGSGTAVWQVWASKSALSTRAAAITPVGVADPGWYDQGAYGDQSSRSVAVPPGRVLTINAVSVHDNKLSEVVDPPPGPLPILTNLRAGTEFIQLHGLIPVGFEPVPPTGLSIFRTLPHMVVTRPASRPVGPLRLTITAASPGPVALGRALSLVAVLSLAAVLVGVGLTENRRRRRGRRSSTLRQPAGPRPRSSRRPGPR